jgi:hypothetical protein
LNICTECHVNTCFSIHLSPKTISNINKHDSYLGLKCVYIFLRQPVYTRLSDPPSFLSKGYRREIKQPGSEADHSPPCSGVAKNAQSYTSSPPYVFTVWYLTSHRDKFTFIYF